VTKVCAKSLGKMAQGGITGKRHCCSQGTEQKKVAAVGGTGVDLKEKGASACWHAESTRVERAQKWHRRLGYESAKAKKGAKRKKKGR